MINPIQIDELLERVSGNKEFVLRMLDMFFKTSDERLSALRMEFNNRNYEGIAEQAHKLKGIVGNLSINQAFCILRDLIKEARLQNDPQIESLLKELDQSIGEARIFYQKNPNLMQE